MKPCPHTDIQSTRLPAASRSVVSSCPCHYRHWALCYQDQVQATSLKLWTLTVPGPGSEGEQTWLGPSWNAYPHAEYIQTQHVIWRTRWLWLWLECSASCLSEVNLYSSISKSFGGEQKQLLQFNPGLLRRIWTYPVVRGRNKTKRVLVGFHVRWASWTIVMQSKHQASTNYRSVWQWIGDILNSKAKLVFHLHILPGVHGNCQAGITYN